MSTKRHLNILFVILSTISTGIGLLSGFLCAYKDVVEDYTKYTQLLNQTTAYQQVLRKEVKNNAEQKMSKTIGWQQINKLSNRIEYLEHHLGGLK